MGLQAADNFTESIDVVEETPLAIKGRLLAETTILVEHGQGRKTDPHSPRRFQALGGCSFVSVLNDCGAQGPGHLSFPKKGTTLALDIPMTSGTPHLVRELNAMVIANGGRIYLAKDSFTTAAEFRQMYPRFEEWNAIRRRFDPHGELASAQSIRLMGD